MSSDRVTGVGLRVRGGLSIDSDWVRIVTTAENIGILREQWDQSSRAPTKGVFRFNTVVRSFQEKSNILRNTKL